uniref:Uncharacterized protein n=1 Tax=Sus scrofa TaxID=9823 RepID=A0A4X1UF00_PIG
MALAAVKWAISSRTVLKHLFPVQSGAPYFICCKPTYSSLQITIIAKESLL